MSGEANGAVEFRLLVLRSTRFDQLRAFYELLGLSFVREQHGSGPVHDSASVGPVVLEIYPTRGESEIDHVRLGFAVGDPDAVFRSLRDSGAEVSAEPRDSAWGRRAVVRDPDGRAVELVQR